MARSKKTADESLREALREVEIAAFSRDLGPYRPDVAALLWWVVQSLNLGFEERVRKLSEIAKIL
jgi:hypothetical protein